MATRPEPNTSVFSRITSGRKVEREDLIKIKKDNAPPAPCNEIKKMNRPR